MSKKLNTIKSFDISIFEIEGGKINLTKICQYFGKNINDWTKTKQTQVFLRAFAEKKAETNIIVSLKGGNGEQGSWTKYREVAIKLAQWISPEFEVFCMEKLDELFRTGKTELKPQRELTRIEILEIALETERENERLRLETTQQQGRLDLLSFTDKTYTTGEIAKEIGLKSANNLNTFLKNRKIQFKQNNTWVLYSKYSNMGYTKIKQEIVGNKKEKAIYNRHWTQKGREFILDLFEEIKDIF